MIFLFMNDIFVQKQNTYNLRNEQVWEIRPVKSVYNDTETLSFRGPKTWDMLPKNIKKSESLQEFTCKSKNGNQIIANAGCVKCMLII